MPVEANLKKETRLRVWCAIFYPESSRPDWRKIWEDNFICAAVSPLHDRDVYEEDDEDDEDESGHGHVAGELKKPHYHVVFRFSGPKSFNQVWDILDMIYDPPAELKDKVSSRSRPPQRPRGDIDKAVQYLVHYNHKNKAQYLQSDIIPINGFDVARYFRLNTEQEDNLVRVLGDFISNNNIFEYWDLLFIKLPQLLDKDPVYEELWRYSRSHTIMINSLLASRRAMFQKKKKEGEDDDES